MRYARTQHTDQRAVLFHLLFSGREQVRAQPSHAMVGRRGQPGEPGDRYGLFAQLHDALGNLHMGDDLAQAAKQ